MSDLDDKLYDKDAGYFKQAEGVSYTVENKPNRTNGVITSAYLEEQMDNSNEEIALDWNKRHGFMTGHEWYDRFIADLELHALDIFDLREKIIVDEFGKEFIAMKRAIASAKRAAGIE